MSNFIYPKQKFVFIHIPKCGGYSLREFVLPKKGRIGPIFDNIPEKYSKFQTMTIIRNPYTRFMSAINMFRYGTDQFKPITKHKNIKYFLDILYSDKVNSEIEQKIKNHIIPQTHPSNCFHMAKHIARFERYQKDVSSILTQVGFSKIKLLHKNVSKNKTKEIITGEHLAKINEYFYEDFTILGYPQFEKTIVIESNACYEYNE